MKGPLVVIGMLSVALGVTLTLLVQRAPAAALAVGGVDVASTSREAACTCDGGECVQGRCVMSGACSRDSDCDDGLPCTAEWCVAGACTGGHRSGACELKDADAGVCEFGFCERPTGSGCVTDLDCAPSANACLERACLSGACTQGSRAPGSDCATALGRPGTCDQGACLASPDSERRLRFTLPTAEVTKLERDLETRLANNLRYDMKAVLVALHGGGYNLVLHNRRSRAEVRGLCDPSFVAFDLADYTAATNWKSAHLQVWLEPDRAGWSVPTRGSRFAVDQGRADSALGAFGVVNVRTFRLWLERAFIPLDDAPSSRTPRSDLEAPHVVPPLPPKPDAGPTTVGFVDAGPPPALSGRQALSRAWDAFGDGRMEEARRLVRVARAQGARDSELEDLLTP